MYKVYLKKFLLFLFTVLVSTSTMAKERKSIVICWDSSVSISDFQAKNSLQSLGQYIDQNPNIDVRLLVFSNQIQQRENFQIINGVWKDLYDSLSTIIYDGGTSYEPLVVEKLTADEILVFTDGLENLSDTKLEFGSETIIYCNDKDCMKRVLNKSSPYVKIVNLKSSNVNSYTVVESDDEEDDNRFSITGYTFDSLGSIEGVSVLNKNTGQLVKTSETGEYVLNITSNDTLQFEIFGFKPLERIASDISKKLILTTDNDNLLNEVILESSSKKDSENLVLVGDRNVNKRELGYEVSTLSEDQIATKNVGLGTAIKGKVAGVEVGYNNDISATIIRGFNTLIGNSHPLIIIDGVTLPRSQLDMQGSTITGGKALDVIDPNNVKSISVLKGLAATNRYGSEGNSGVILVTTKTGSFSKNKKEIKDLGTTKYFDGNASKNINSFQDPLLSILDGVEDIEAAYEIYLKQRKTRKNDYSFYLVAGRYFQGWNNSILTKRVLSNSVEVANESIESLRAISYVYEELGYFDQAIAILEKIYLINSEDLQVTRNLALLYVRNGNIAKSLEKYLICQTVLDKYPANFLGLEKNIVAEFRSFVTRYGSEIDHSVIQSKFRRSNQLHKRIVFEWSKNNSQFNIQIVNPQNRFYTWSHTLEANPSRMSKEKEQGYRLEEYFLTKADVGKWIFNLENIQSITEDSKDLYFKISLYDNFGTINESVKTKVVKMSELNKNSTVLELKI